MFSIARRVVTSIYRTPRLATTITGCVFGLLGTRMLRRTIYTEPEKSADQAKHFNLGAVVEEDDPEKAVGLKIIVVKPDSLAQQYALMEDDLIVEVDGMPIKSFNDYQKALLIRKDNTKSFRLVRQGSQIVIQITFK